MYWYHCSNIIALLPPSTVGDTSKADHEAHYCVFFSWALNRFGGSIRAGAWMLAKAEMPK